MRSHYGQFLILAAAMLWGTTGTAQALAPAGADPASVGTLRLVIGGLGLLAISGARNGGLNRPLTWPLRPMLGAAISVAAYQLCFFGGVARAGVAVGTIVGIGSAPIMAGALGWWLRREPLNRRWWVATALAIAGCVLLLWPNGETLIDSLGVLLSLGAGLAYTLYAIGSKALLERYPPDAVMAVIFCLGAAMLVPLLLATDLRWVGAPGGLLTALHLGLVATTLSYVLFARGLVHVFAATAVTLSLAEPLTAGLLGVVILGERLTGLALAGVGLMVIGLALLALPDSYFGQVKDEFSESESRRG